jgi:hypothetical protein
VRSGVACSAPGSARSTSCPPAKRTCEERDAGVIEDTNREVVERPDLPYLAGPLRRGTGLNGP